MVVDRSTLDVAVARVGVVGVPHTKEMKILFVRGRVEFHRNIGPHRVRGKREKERERGALALLVYNRYRWILAREFSNVPPPSMRRGEMSRCKCYRSPTFSTRPRGAETFPLRFSTDRCTPRSFTGYAVSRVRTCKRGRQVSKAITTRNRENS